MPQKIAKNSKQMETPVVNVIRDTVNTKETASQEIQTVKLLTRFANVQPAFMDLQSKENVKIEFSDFIRYFNIIFFL